MESEHAHTLPPLAGPARAIVAFVICALIAVVVEVGFFNFDWLMSFGSGEPITISPLDGSDQTEKYGSLVLNDLDTKVSSMRVQFKDDANTWTSVYAMDESMSEYRYIGSVSESGEPLYFHQDGKALSISLDVDSWPSQVIESITLNGVTPIDFSWLRFGTIALLLFAFWLIRPSSSWWDERALDHKKAFPICACVMCCIALVVLLVRTFTAALDINDIRGMQQYTDLARALLSGQVFLDIQPSDELLALSNPYDPAMREGVDYLWDYAFFDGRYYTYFGVVPCIVFYLPFYLVTGMALPNIVVTAIAVFAFYMGSVYVIRRIVGRWFPQATISAVVLCAVVMLFGTMSLSLVSLATIYPVPIACGAACAIWGLALWLRACEDERFLWGHAILGTLLGALTLGCRPQLFVVFLFILALFIDAVRGGRVKARAFFLLIIPIVVVGVLLCLYNYARFGSPLDFGSSYNLTNDDMSKHGVSLYVGALGVFGFLLQPPQIIADWPFVVGTSLSYAQNSDLVLEETFGGIFTVAPLTLAAFWFFSQKRLRQPAILLALSIIGVVCAFLFAVFDACAGGLILRYQVDMAFFAALPACIGVLAALGKLLPLGSLPGSQEGVANLQYAVKMGVAVLTSISIALPSLYFLGV